MRQARYYRWVIVFAALALNVLCFGGLALGFIKAETVFLVDLSPENIKPLAERQAAAPPAQPPRSGQPQITSPAGMKGAIRQGDVGEGHKPTFPDTRPAYGRAYAGVAQRDD